jgi:hypothetical protein
MPWSNYEEEFGVINETQITQTQCNDKLSGISTNNMYKIVKRHGK